MSNNNQYLIPYSSIPDWSEVQSRTDINKEYYFIPTHTVFETTGILTKRKTIPVSYSTEPQFDMEELP